MKSNLMKILILTFAFAFFSAGASMAGERQRDRRHTLSNRTNVHYKADRHHNYGHREHYRKHASSRHYKKHYGQKHCYKYHKRHHHQHHYHGAVGYPLHNSLSFGVAVLDPNMAFSIDVNGR